MAKTYFAYKIEFDKNIKTEQYLNKDQFFA